MFIRQIANRMEEKLGNTKQKGVPDRRVPSKLLQSSITDRKDSSRQVFPN